MFAGESNPPPFWFSPTRCPNVSQHVLIELLGPLLVVSCLTSALERGASRSTEFWSTRRDLPHKNLAVKLWGVPNDPIRFYSDDDRYCCYYYDDMTDDVDVDKEMMLMFLLVMMLMKMKMKMKKKKKMMMMMMMMMMRRRRMWTMPQLHLVNFRTASATVFSVSVTRPPDQIKRLRLKRISTQQNNTIIHWKFSDHAC